MNRLKGKVAVATGTSKEIGASIAEHLAEGATAAVNYVSSKNGADAVVARVRQKSRKAIAIQRDVSKPEDIQRLFSETKKELGRVDVLDNNAGTFEFAPLGQYDIMPLAVQVVSSHLLGVLDIESAVSAENWLGERLLPHAGSEAEALKPSNFARLFLLDGCSLTSPLGPLSSRLRANSPGSKFLALLEPNRFSEAEMIGLFHWGIDGMLVLDEDWKSELLKATFALLGNRLWVPSKVLLAFIKPMKALLDRQLLPGQHLTGRESRVLQLLLRRLTNKEIAYDLKISERTAKFHVCSVLNKLGLENRKNLVETFGLASV